MNLLRCAGVMLLPLCGWLAGSTVRQKAMQHLAALEQTIALLQRIRQEIVFRRTDLTSLYNCLCREKAFLLDADAGSFQAAVPPQELAEPERCCLQECLQGLGRSEAAQEAQRLEYYISRFQSFLHDSQCKAQQQGTLPDKIGLSAGAVLALVFWK